MGEIVFVAAGKVTFVPVQKGSASRQLGDCGNKNWGVIKIKKNNTFFILQS